MNTELLPTPKTTTEAIAPRKPVRQLFDRPAKADHKPGESKFEQTLQNRERPSRDKEPSVIENKKQEKPVQTKHATSTESAPTEAPENQKTQLASYQDSLKKVGRIIGKGSLATDQSEALAFIAGDLQKVNPESVLDIVSQNPFIKEAIGENIGDFMKTPMTVGELLQKLNLPSEIEDQAKALGLDLNAQVTPVEFFKQIGIDPHRVVAQLEKIKQELPSAGVTSLTAEVASHQRKIAPAIMNSKYPQKAEAGLNKNQQPLGQLPNKVLPNQLPNKVLPNHLASNNPLLQQTENINTFENTATTPGLFEQSNVKQNSSASLTESNKPSSLLQQLSGIPSANGKPLESTIMAQASTTKTEPNQQIKSLSDMPNKQLDQLMSVPKEISTASNLQKPESSQLIKTNIVTEDPFTKMKMPEQSQSSDKLTFDSIVKSESANLSTTTPNLQQNNQPLTLQQLNEQLNNQNIAEEEARQLQKSQNDQNYKSDGSANLNKQTVLGGNIATQLFSKQPNLDTGLSTLDKTAQLPIEGTLSKIESHNNPQSESDDSSRDQQESEPQQNSRKDLLGNLGALQSTNKAKAFTLETEVKKVEVEQQHFTETVIKNAKMMVKNGGGSAVLDLSSPEMGHLKLAIQVEADKVNLKILTSSDKAKSMISGEMTKLLESLSSHNLQLKEVEMSTSEQFLESNQNHEQNFFANQQQQQQKNQRDQISEQLDRLTSNTNGQVNQVKNNFKNQISQMRKGFNPYSRIQVAA